MDGSAPAPQDKPDRLGAGPILFGAPDGRALPVCSPGASLRRRRLGSQGPVEEADPADASAALPSSTPQSPGSAIQRDATGCDIAPPVVIDGYAVFDPWTGPRALPSTGYCDSRPLSRVGGEMDFSCGLPRISHSGHRGFENSFGQFLIVDARLSGRHRQEARLRHARNRIDLEHVGTSAWSDAKIHSGSPGAPQDLIGPKTKMPNQLRNG